MEFDEFIAVLVGILLAYAVGFGLILAIAWYLS